MKNEPINQHDNPSVYLRRFSYRKNHVWCLFNHEHEGWKIEEKSVNANYFKYRHIYTLHNSPEPYALEQLLDTELENKYFQTINKILNSQQIEPSEIGFLSLWLYISKLRNLNTKEDSAITIKKMLRQIAVLQGKLNDNTKEEIKKISEQNSNYFFPKILENTKILENFCDLMAGKSWEVLVAGVNKNFLTNDNPGYSFNLEQGRIDVRTISYIFTIHPNAANVYPISPKHCLHVIPIAYNKEDKVDSIPKLYYRYVDDKIVDEINKRTIEFKKRYLISKNKEDLMKIKSSM